MGYIRLQRIGIFKFSARLFCVLKAKSDSTVELYKHSDLLAPNSGNLKSRYVWRFFRSRIHAILCYFGYRPDVCSVLVHEQRSTAVPLKDYRF